MKEKQRKHSKHYYETGRNLDWRQEVIEDKSNKWEGGKINPKMLMTKEELDLDSRIPEYYKGKGGYEARKVCDNFDLTYHIGTAVTYLLRAYRKHDTPVDCIKKAIAHLEFELEKLQENS